jgi:DNA-binding transcriptional LysR family regulator
MLRTLTRAPIGKPSPIVATQRRRSPVRTARYAYEPASSRSSTTPSKRSSPAAGGVMSPSGIAGAGEAISAVGARSGALALAGATASQPSSKAAQSQLHGQYDGRRAIGAIAVTISGLSLGLRLPFVHCMGFMRPMQDDHGSAVDLNLLVALETLVEERNVTRAAARLGLTQSAMSHKLRRLREEFGDPLLVQGQRGMVATAAAERLLGPIRRGLREIRAGLRTAESFDPATSQRVFTVVTTDYAEFAILPKVLAYTTEHAPGVSATMREIWPGMFDALEDGSADLIVGTQLPPTTGLVQRKIGEDGFMCAVRRGHPKVGDALDLETYLSLHHVLVAPNARSPVGVVDDALAQQGRSRHIAIRVPHFLGGPFIAAQSDLCLTAPRALLLHTRDILGLRLFEPPIELPATRVFMVWHERASDDAGNAWLRELTARCTSEVHDRRE